MSISPVVKAVLPDFKLNTEVINPWNVARN